MTGMQDECSGERLEEREHRQTESEEQEERGEEHEIVVSGVRPGSRYSGSCLHAECVCQMPGMPNSFSPIERAPTVAGVCLTRSGSDGVASDEESVVEPAGREIHQALDGNRPLSDLARRLLPN